MTDTPLRRWVEESWASALAVQLGRELGLRRRSLWIPAAAGSIACDLAGCDDRDWVEFVWRLRLRLLENER